MSLFPRASFGPMRHELGPIFNLFNDTINELQKVSDSTSRAFAPKFDVKEVKDAYVLEGELPGIEQKDIVIEFSDDHTLTIKGHTEHFQEQGKPPAAATTVQVEEVKGPQNGAAETKEVATTKPAQVAKAEPPPPQHTYWVSERSVGEFMRSFNFPNRVDPDHIKASLKNGILSVVVPKVTKQNLSRRIAIE